MLCEYCTRSVCVRSSRRMSNNFPVPQVTHSFSLAKTTSRTAVSVSTDKMACTPQSISKKPWTNLTSRLTPNRTMVCFQRRREPSMHLHGRIQLKSLICQRKRSEDLSKKLSLRSPTPSLVHKCRHSSNSHNLGNRIKANVKAWKNLAARIYKTSQSRS